MARKAEPTHTSQVRGRLPPRYVVGKTVLWAWAAAECLLGTHWAQRPGVEKGSQGLGGRDDDFELHLLDSRQLLTCPSRRWYLQTDNFGRLMWYQRVGW